MVSVDTACALTPALLCSRILHLSYPMSLGFAALPSSASSGCSCGGCGGAWLTGRLLSALLVFVMHPVSSRLLQQVPSRRCSEMLIQGTASGIMLHCDRRV
jgi:hypothetical protein